MGDFDNPWDSPFGRKMTMRDMEKMQRMAQRDIRKERQERERLRGCGDPDCYMCNPEIADRRRRTGEGRGARSSMANMYGGPPPVIRDEMVRMISEEFNNGPRDSSYDKAKKAVEKYIHDMPDEVSFDDIIGNEEALAELRDAIEGPVKYAELYEAYGMKMPKGALLFGPPGCGKTMFAKAAARQMKTMYGKKGMLFLSISGAELQTPIVGMTEAIIISIFDFGREYQKKFGAPLLVFIDEAEVILPDRTGRTRTVAPWEESQVSTFLAEMDGTKGNGVFLLLASNRPGEIDQAVLRDGRCDYKIQIRRPTKEAMEVILMRSLEGIFTKAKVEDLAFAALEAFYDPHKIIAHAQHLEIDMKQQRVIDLGGKNFCLEHIVNGAMAVGIRQRAIRKAFGRDKESGKKPTGVKVDDVISAVNDVFRENQPMDHSYALSEFRAEFGREIEAQKEAKAARDAGGKLN